MPRVLSRPAQSLRRPLSAIRTRGCQQHRSIHPAPVQLEESKPTDATNSKTTTSSSTAAGSRQRRSALALRQIQRLGSSRTRQGVVGLTRGGFEPKEQRADENATRPPSPSSASGQRDDRSVIRRIDAKSAPSSQSASRTRSNVPQAHIRRTSTQGQTNTGSTRRLGPAGPPRRTAGQGASPKDSRATRRKTKGSGPSSVQALKAEEQANEELFWLRDDHPIIDEADHVPYNPGVAEDDESLVIAGKVLATSRTASLAGSSGPASEMSAALGRLAQRPDTTWAIDAEIARRLLSGQIVRFKDDEEQQRVLELAEQMALRTAWAKAARKNTPFSRRDVSFAPIEGAQRKMLVNKVIKGHYELHGQKQDKTTVQQNVGRLQTSLQMKETYNPAASKAFLETFQKLWPAQATQKPAANKAKS